MSQNVGQYELLETLGSGAVGSAYKARHCQTGELVALKLMHERLESDPEVHRRFVREVSVLEKLDHQNIVRHLDCGLDDGRLFFAMEWVEFGSLQEVLERRHQLAWREAIECGIQICDGLEHAHGRGVIHRDLKPANLFLSADGLVKIGDFGLARDADLHRLTMQGNTVGSCRFMAPEQVRGEDVLTGAVDLYALGCVMFRIIAGRVPFDGATIMEIFEHHLYTDIPTLPPADDDRPSELDDLIEKLLIKDPAERPGKAGEVRSALAAILAGDRVAMHFTPAATAADQRCDEPPDSEPNLSERLVYGEPAAAAAGRRFAALAVVLGLGVIVGVILWLQSQ